MDEKKLSPLMPTEALEYFLDSESSNRLYLRATSIRNCLENIVETIFLSGGLDNCPVDIKVLSFASKAKRDEKLKERKLHINPSWACYTSHDSCKRLNGFVFVGGGLGSVARFLVSRFVTSKFEVELPLGTLIVNVLGSLLLGLFIGLIQRFNYSEAQLVLLFTVGFCGGFSTFSTFSYETIELIKNGNHLVAVFNVLLSLMVCLFLGYKLAK